MNEERLSYNARRQFSRRYTPVLMAGLLCASGALSATMNLVITTYLREAPVDEVGPMVMTVVCTQVFLIILSNYLIARGRPQGMWIMVAVSFVCLASAVPTIAFQPNPILYALALLLPLLCLLILNSSRHREFRKHCLSFRHERDAVTQQIKAQRALEKKREMLRARGRSGRSRQH
ncbi:hypothetical protein RRX38_18910 [Pseudomonas sp. DTU_2021_1001937_2_SI_NGA_ILE_001]|uniref:hypothetical protein n=1 Tax=Pseudomonas sp. DTU_2021_1001937_2_SI_NGA_ILE_001 TaxID=3077589 RepID=UPI0028FC2404|nr:hypothetical protein [Pseudomonas sp. DTU_2021_1001937_2_SI_NGA_ILE_001]WNW13138.1 hypothetical protein RRX38_18910 [Pseudomonas sp. DTU_2021_1001937_2_SI_NGA_ILE_001]